MLVDDSIKIKTGRLLFNEYYKAKFIESKQYEKHGLFYALYDVIWHNFLPRSLKNETSVYNREHE